MTLALRLNLRNGIKVRWDGPDEIFGKITCDRHLLMSDPGSVSMIF